MSNKLEELKVKYRQLLDYGPIPEKVKQALEDAFVDWCVEYAKYTCEDYPITLDRNEGFDIYHAQVYGWDECTKHIKSRIDQDLHSLTEESKTSLHSIPHKGNPERWEEEMNISLTDKEL